MFRHDQPSGRPFNNAGYSGFPMLSLDLVHFRETADLKHMREAYDLLQPLGLSEKLDKSCIGNHSNESFDDDLAWRLDHLGVKLDFWDLSLADMPLELSERAAFGAFGPIRPRNLSRGPLDPSVLGNHVDQFDGAHIVVAPFRCFHRNDGRSCHPL